MVIIVDFIIGRCRTGISSFITRALYRNMNVMWRYRPGFYMRAWPLRNKLKCRGAITSTIILQRPFRCSYPTCAALVTPAMAL